jgi:hypothetical protein
VVSQFIFTAIRTAGSPFAKPDIGTRGRTQHRSQILGRAGDVNGIVGQGSSCITCWRHGCRHRGVSECSCEWAQATETGGGRALLRRACPFLRPLEPRGSGREAVDAVERRESNILITGWPTAQSTKGAPPELPLEPGRAASEKGRHQEQVV